MEGMKGWVRAVLYGIAGLIVAFGLTFSAFALAGSDLSQPAKPFLLDRQESSPGDARVTPYKETKSPQEERNGSPQGRPTEAGGDDPSVSGSNGESGDNAGSDGTSSPAGDGSGGGSPKVEGSGDGSGTGGSGDGSGNDGSDDGSDDDGGSGDGGDD
jgi:hypothetical protein